MELNEQQRKAVEYVLTGHNIFLTGCAGTGKSFTIKTIVEEMKKRGKNVNITASTGIAATTIGGRTLHSWAGIGIDMEADINKLVNRVLRDEKKCKRWESVDLLIIDEISMVDFKMMEVMDEIAQYIRQSSAPFGGIQLLLTGDFYQLPPVQKDRKEPVYMFECDIWNKLVHKNVLLEKVYRQESKDFVELLTRIRHNSITKDDVDRIKKTIHNNLKNEHGIKPTILYCTRRDVAMVNNTELRKLPGDAFTSVAHEFYANDELKAAYKNNWQYPTELKLKVGAQVMLLTNVYPGYCNGSRGVVEEIDDPEIKIKFLNGKTLVVKRESIEVKDGADEVVASIEQFPLMLAWCMTVHKSQGQTIELVDIDLAKVFTYAQSYVAISRGVSLDKMRIKNFSEKVVRTNDKVVKFYDSITENQENDLSVKIKRRKLQ